MPYRKPDNDPHNLVEGYSSDGPESLALESTANDSRIAGDAFPTTSWTSTGTSDHRSSYGKCIDRHAFGRMTATNSFDPGASDVEFTNRGKIRVNLEPAYYVSEDHLGRSTPSKDTVQMLETMQNTARIYQQHMFYHLPETKGYGPSSLVPQASDLLQTVTSSAASRNLYLNEASTRPFSAGQPWHAYYQQGHQDLQNLTPDTKHPTCIGQNTPSEPDLDQIEMQFHRTIETVKSKQTRQALHRIDPALSRRELLRIYRKVVGEDSSLADVSRAGSPLSAYLSDELEQAFSSDCEETSSSYERASPKSRSRILSRRPDQEWSSTSQSSCSQQRQSFTESAHQSLLYARPYLSDIAPEHTRGHHPSTIPKSPVRCASRTSSLSIGLRSTSRGWTPDTPVQRNETWTPTVQNASNNADVLPTPNLAGIPRQSSPFRRPTEPASSIHTGLSSPLRFPTNPLAVPSTKSIQDSIINPLLLPVSRPDTPRPRPYSDSVYSTIEHTDDLPLQSITLPTILNRSASPSPVSVYDNFAVSQPETRQNSSRMGLPAEDSNSRPNYEPDTAGTSTGSQLISRLDSISHRKVESAPNLGTVARKVSDAPRHPSDPFLTGQDQIMFPPPAQTPPLSPLTHVAGGIYLAKRGQRTATTPVRSSKRKTTRNRAVSAKPPGKRVVDDCTSDIQGKAAVHSLQGDGAKVSKSRLRRARKLMPVASKTPQGTSDNAPVPSLTEVMEVDTSSHRLATSEVLDTIENGLAGVEKTTTTPTRRSKKPPSTFLTPNAAGKSEFTPPRRSPRLARR